MDAVGGNTTMLEDHVWWRSRRPMLIGLVLGLCTLLMAAPWWVSVAPGQEESEEVEELPVGFVDGELPSEPTPEELENGKKVYFSKCVWCHGVEGAGDGPGADRLWPRPRNFNQGTFKVRHTFSGELPLLEDLFETVTHGLPGSAMPPWNGILNEQQRRDVVSFVAFELIQDRAFTDEEFEYVTQLELDTLEPIPTSPESVEQGKAVFDRLRCAECHGQDGRGDGNPFNLKDDWGFAIQPADFHKCWNFRGSRQDPYNVKNVFRTFSTGLNGTPMPSFADQTTIEERWHLSNFVNSLCERDFEGEPLKIDPLTDKPVIKFVLRSGFVDTEVVEDGRIPSDPSHAAWEARERRFIGMAGQIIHKSRNFVNKVDNIFVRSLYDNDDIAFLFEWNDRSQSIKPDDVEAFMPEETPPSGDPIAGKVRAYGPFNDALAIQFPTDWASLSPPEKPRFIHGDSKNSVDIWKWESDGAIRALTGTGALEPLVEREASSAGLQVVFSEYKNGKWTLMMKRSLAAQNEGDVEFIPGEYIPTVFFAWEGHNGDYGLKMAISTFYNTILEPPIPASVAWYAIFIGMVIVVVEVWVLTGRRNRAQGKVV
tara:strand:+ start:5925 stop:7712 length:1788 start_codon:yes stop_codon:yes gene_type:complete